MRNRATPRTEDDMRRMSSRDLRQKAADILLQTSGGDGIGQVRNILSIIESRDHQEKDLHPDLRGT